MADNTIRTIDEPARRTPLAAEVDVLVAGGGPAGIAAALAAARSGASTMLIERYGYLGGMITGAHVVAILGVGDGHRPLARGITEEIRQRLGPLGGIKGWSDAADQGDEQPAGDAPGDYVVDAETFKWQAAKMLLDAGVQLRLHTMVCDPLLEQDRVTGVTLESKSGREAVLARVIIDATADADLAARAGVGYENETHEVTLGLVLQGVDQEEVDRFRAADPEAYQRVTAEARRINGGHGLVGSGLLRGIDVADAQDLTRAEVQLRREAFGALRHLQMHVPGYAQARIAVTRPQLGVRQGRRIHGEYTVVDEDLQTSRRFPDSIARLGVYFPDWGPIYRKKGLAYDLPYRCIVPQSIDGLLVVGRAVSCDYVTCNTLRLIVPCLATGQAAGVAAGIAVELDCSPRSVPIDLLQRGLSAQDVYLG